MYLHPFLVGPLCGFFFFFDGRARGWFSMNLLSILFYFLCSAALVRLTFIFHHLRRVWIPILISKASRFRICFQSEHQFARFLCLYRHR